MVAARDLVQHSVNRAPVIFTVGTDDFVVSAVTLFERDSLGMLERVVVVRPKDDARHGLNM